MVINSKETINSLGSLMLNILCYRESYEESKAITRWDSDSLSPQKGFTISVSAACLAGANIQITCMVHGDHFF